MFEIFRNTKTIVFAALQLDRMRISFVLLLSTTTIKTYALEDAPVRTGGRGHIRRGDPGGRGGGGQSHTIDAAVAGLLAIGGKVQRSKGTDGRFFVDGTKTRGDASLGRDGGKCRNGGEAGGAQEDG